MSPTNNIKYYDTDTIFKLNPDMDITVKYLQGKYPVLIINNVYCNPDMVRDLCLNTPVPYTSRMVETAYPGRRGELSNFIDSDIFFKTLSDIIVDKLGIKKHFNKDIILRNNGEFLFNVFDSDENTSNEHRYTLPHSDASMVASVIYLNKDDEEPVGTSIYRNIKHDIIIKPSHDYHLHWVCDIDNVSHNDYMNKVIDFQNETHVCTDNHVLDGNCDYEKLIETTGEYNQMIAYIGGMLHSPMIDYNHFKNKNYKRINQVIFWDYYGD